MDLAILLHESDALTVFELQKKIEEGSCGRFLSFFPLFINFSLPLTKISQAKNFFSGVKIFSPQEDEKGIFLPVKISFKAEESKGLEENLTELDSYMRISVRVPGKVREGKPCREVPGTGFAREGEFFADFSISLKRFQLALFSQADHTVTFSDKIWISL